MQATITVHIQVVMMGNDRGLGVSLEVAQVLQTGDNQYPRHSSRPIR